MRGAGPGGTERRTGEGKGGGVPVLDRSSSGLGWNRSLPLRRIPGSNPPTSASAALGASSAPLRPSRHVHRRCSRDSDPTSTGCRGISSGLHPRICAAQLPLPILPTPPSALVPLGPVHCSPACQQLPSSLPRSSSPPSPPLSAPPLPCSRSPPGRLCGGGVKLGPLTSLSESLSMLDIASRFAHCRSMSALKVEGLLVSW